MRLSFVVALFTLSLTSLVSGQMFDWARGGLSPKSRFRVYPLTITGDDRQGVEDYEPRCWEKEIRPAKVWIHSHPAAYASRSLSGIRWVYNIRIEPNGQAKEVRDGLALGTYVAKSALQTCRWWGAEKAGMMRIDLVDAWQDKGMSSKDGWGVRLNFEIMKCKKGTWCEKEVKWDEKESQALLDCISHGIVRAMCNPDDMKIMLRDPSSPDRRSLELDAPVDRDDGNVKDAESVPKGPLKTIEDWARNAVETVGERLGEPGVEISIGRPGWRERQQKRDVLDDADLEDVLDGDAAGLYTLGYLNPSTDLGIQEEITNHYGFDHGSHVKREAEDEAPQRGWFQSIGDWFRNRWPFNRGKKAEDEKQQGGSDANSATLQVLSIARRGEEWTFDGGLADRLRRDFRAICRDASRSWTSEAKFARVICREVFYRTGMEAETPSLATVGGTPGQGPASSDVVLHRIVGEFRKVCKEVDENQANQISPLVNLICKHMPKSDESLSQEPGLRDAVVHRIAEDVQNLCTEVDANQANQISPLLNLVCKEISSRQDAQEQTAAKSVEPLNLAYGLTDAAKNRIVEYLQKLCKEVGESPANQISSLINLVCQQLPSHQDAQEQTEAPSLTDAAKNRIVEDLQKLCKEVDENQANRISPLIDLVCKQFSSHPDAQEHTVPQSETPGLVDAAKHHLVEDLQQMCKEVDENPANQISPLVNELCMEISSGLNAQGQALATSDRSVRRSFTRLSDRKVQRMIRKFHEKCRKIEEGRARHARLVDRRLCKKISSHRNAQEQTVAKRAGSVRLDSVLNDVVVSRILDDFQRICNEVDEGRATHTPPLVKLLCKETAYHRGAAGQTLAKRGKGDWVDWILSEEVTRRFKAPWGEAGQQRGGGPVAKSTGWVIDRVDEFLGNPPRITDSENGEKEWVPEHHDTEQHWDSGEQSSGEGEWKPDSGEQWNNGGESNGEWSEGQEWESSNDGQNHEESQPSHPPCPCQDHHG